jgi:neurofibromin 1
LTKDVQPYEHLSPRNRPQLVLLTQTYLVELLADCTAANWDAADVAHQDLPFDDNTTSAFSSRRSRRRDVDPPPLDDGQARYTMELLLKLTSTPNVEEAQPEKKGQQAEERSLDGLPKKPSELDKATFKVIEFLSASNWPLVYQTMRAKLKILRSSSEDVDASGLQFIAHLSLNQKKLSLVLQEISGSFLPLRKTPQNTLAALLPEAIHRWIDSHPKDFIQLHQAQQRLEGGADILFDFAGSLTDGTKRRAVIWPLQTALVLLLPEVFVHADMSGSQRGNSLAKKIVFLNNLRQALRQPKSADIAASCLITICRAGSLFTNDSDSALLSFALDMQNDMGEEIFKKSPLGAPAAEDVVDRDVLIKAFVSLARLSVDSVVEHLVPRCLDKNSPMSFKITVFAGAAVLASQPNPEQYAILFETIAPELREYLHGISSMRKAASAVPFNGTLNEKMRRNISTDSIGSVELLYQLLELLKIRPLLLYENLDTHGDNWNQLLDKSIDSILKLVCDDDEFVRNSTVIFARRLLSPEAFQVATRMDMYQDADKVLEFFWTGT